MCNWIGDPNCSKKKAATFLVAPCRFVTVLMTVPIYQIEIFFNAFIMRKSITNKENEESIRSFPLLHHLLAIKLGDCYNFKLEVYFSVKIRCNPLKSFTYFHLFRTHVSVLTFRDDSPNLFFNQQLAPLVLSNVNAMHPGVLSHALKHSVNGPSQYIISFP